MIEVRVSPDEITIVGHAQFDEHGKDIVCAGVSVLYQALIESIHELTEDRAKYTIVPGNSKIICKDFSEESKLLVDSFLIGIKGIAEAHPNHVKVI